MTSKETSPKQVIINCKNDGTSVDTQKMKDRIPDPPTVDLRNWVTNTYQEPCSNCGGGHEGRAKFVCSQCNKLFCTKLVREIDGEFRHVIAWREAGRTVRTWCGPVDRCGEWDSIVAKLNGIIEDLA